MKMWGKNYLTEKTNISVIRFMIIERFVKNDHRLLCWTTISTRLCCCSWKAPSCWTGTLSASSGRRSCTVQLHRRYSLKFSQPHPPVHCTALESATASAGLVHCCHWAAAVTTQSHLWVFSYLTVPLWVFCFAVPFHAFFFHFLIAVVFSLKFIWGGACLQ